MAERPQVCIQKKTGSCLGCPVLYEIYQYARQNPVTVAESARKIQKNACPSDAHPQLDHITHKGNLHSFGQPREIELTNK